MGKLEIVMLHKKIKPVYVCMYVRVCVCVCVSTVKQTISNKMHYTILNCNPLFLTHPAVAVAVVVVNVVLAADGILH